MRSIRAFWSWLASEEIIGTNLFSKLKIPKPPKKVIATFSEYQIVLLLGVICGSTEGHRDMIVILTLLDTGLRVNELINLKMDNVWLEEGLIKVLGKGNSALLFISPILPSLAYWSIRERYHAHNFLLD